MAAGVRIRIRPLLGQIVSGRAWCRPEVGCRTILTPANVGEPTKTLNEVIHNLSTEVIGGPSNYDPDRYEEARNKLVPLLPASQKELPARRMLDSFDQAIIPLGTDRILRDRYSTHLGGVRIGRLLEDMDVFSVFLVFKHLFNPKVSAETSQLSPYAIVTAMVDEINVQKKIANDRDIKMSGHVTWVGRSSAEARLLLHQMTTDGWQLVTEASFVLVARHPINGGVAYINPMLIETPEEQQLFQQGEKSKMERMASSGDSLFSHPPSETEKNLIHDFFIQTVDHKALSFKARVKPVNSMWMEDAKLKNLVVCQPENRNRFNKIFGGFLMRQAFELGWANAYVYARRRPFIEFMDDILFQAPVDIGSLLYFNSQVCFVQDNFIQVRVSAEVLDPLTGNLTLTNVFHYTFSLTDGKAPIVIPKTYHEAMLYLDGRRHFLKSSVAAAN